MRKLYDKNDLGKAFGLAVTVMLLASVVLSLAFGNTESDLAFWLMQALYQLAICSVAFIYAFASRTDVCSATGMNRAPKLAHVGWGWLATMFLVALMLPVNDWFVQLIVKMGFSEPSVDLPMQIVPLILIACVLPAVSEELVFRGTISKTLERSSNKWATLAVCGALFSLFHLNAAQTLHQFVLGAMLTLLALRSGSVWTASLVHLFNNLLAVLLSFTVADESVFVRYWYIFVPVGAIGFVVSIFGYLKTTKSSWLAAEECKTDGSSTMILAISVVVCAVLWIINLVGNV